METSSTVEGFFTSSIHGLSFRQVQEFGSVKDWADPALRSFFSTAKVDTQIEDTYLPKEFFDRSLALLLLIAFSPIMIAIAIAMKIVMPGKIFYGQTRVGKGGRLFKVLKFRSMIEDAEAQTGHTLSWDGDPRITSFGNFLRKSHLDELPQLINVLIGDMYFIGPRPERHEFTNLYDQQIPDYSKRHSVKPGITGLAQISCVYAATAEEKLKYDIMFIAQRNSVVLNTLIAFHTARKMVFMKATAGVLI
jgi:lipopolysaccharide/colanic/teichoic acid biosynthesis glycosyltransferase